MLEPARHPRFSPVLLAVLFLFVSLSALVDVPKEVSAHTPHGPIFIDGDGDFTLANGVVAGSGAWNDPFIIEGWEIDDPASESIWLNYTSAHVIIRDVYVHSGMSNPYGGIRLWFSSNVTVSNSLLTDNQHPLWSFGGSNHTVAGNNISFNQYGLTIYYTDHVVVSNNVFWNGGVAIGMGRHEMVENLVITPDNLVNGKPVLFLVNEVGLMIKGVSVGQLLLANVTDSVVEDLTIEYTNTAIWGRGLHNVSFRNLTLSNNSFGVGLGNCHDEWPYCDDNVSVSGSRFMNNTYGVTVEFVRDSSIHHNVMEGNQGGIFSASLRNVSISDNDLSRNEQGLHISAPFQGVRVEDNNISENMEGISIWASRHTDCEGGLICHNRLLNNTQQAFEFIHYQVPGEPCFQWDDGYPSGGNYWSDYSGMDSFRGPGQNILGSDGIGDSPVLIPSAAEDRYPLMSPEMVYPLPPEHVNAHLSGNGYENVTVTWEPSADEPLGLVDRYEVYRGLDYDESGGSYLLLGTAPNGTHSLEDFGAGEGNPDTYFYMVCAVNASNTLTCADNQAAKFTRPLAPGPNLISIPLIQSDESIGTVLQTVRYDRVWYYDSSGEWLWFAKGKTYGKGLWTMDHTMGTWASITEASNLTVAGAVPAQTVIQLHAGWNLVSFPSFDASYSVLDLRADVGETRVEGYDMTAPPTFLRQFGDMDLLHTGEAYWVKVGADIIWTVGVS